MPERSYSVFAARRRNCDAMSTNKWQKARADKHREAGLCLDCIEPAKTGRVRCEKHLRLHAESNRRRVPIFRKNGICIACRKGIAERFWHCRQCRERQAELYANRNKKRAAGSELEQAIWSVIGSQNKAAIAMPYDKAAGVRDTCSQIFGSNEFYVCTAEAAARMNDAEEKKA